jgi:phosphoglucan,water dikinase
LNMPNDNRIRIGNQTAFMAASPLEPFYYAVENGFDAFEWFPDKKESGAGWETADIPAEKRREIRKIARSHDMLLTVHAPWWVSPLLPETKALLHDQILFAGQIGAGLVNMHLSTGEGVEEIAKALVPMITATHAAGLKLALENTPDTPPEDFNRLFAWWRDHEDIATAHVGMCLDLGHANLCPSTRNDYVRYLEELAPHVPIIHMHLHENFGDHDSHLPIFTGPAGQNDSGVRTVLKRLAQRGFIGAIILEQWPEPRSLLRDGRARLLDILQDYQPRKAHRPQQAEAAPPATAPPPLPSKKETAAKAADRKPKMTEKTVSRPAKKPSRDGFFKALVRMDGKCRSWRQKLDGVLTLLADDTFGPSKENLVYLAIYLRFLGTGEISTIEDGRHYRPSHHARTAQQIIKKLTAITTRQNTFIKRKIYPWLPSYDSRFIRAEPLTRIRDIAHRNDIPPELKKEIKHTLQNKLHRCAGPEDLDTSAALLQRITDSGSHYAAAFIEQFKIFHEELQEFFNTASLEKRLEKFFDDKKIGDAAQRFLAAKKGLANDPEQQLAVLSLATDLRDLLLNNAGEAVDARAQDMRLADIGLEDYEFVLLSALITNIEGSRKMPWAPSFRTLLLILENLRYSGILPELSGASAAALETLGRDFDPGSRDHLLRLKAALAGCRRLTETYSDLILRLFFEKVERLGHKLGIDEHAIKAYCEGDIRGNLIFQLSRLTALLIKEIRQAAALGPWDVVVAGTARGRLVTAEDLEKIKVSGAEPLLVLLDEAEGDETVPPGVAGIILAHDLPHLSHLAIRTRQDHVVMIAGNDEARINELKKLQGQSLVLKAATEAVTIEQAVGKSAAKKQKKSTPVMPPEVELVARQPVLELEQVSLSNGGAKAYGAQLLRTLARRAEADFTTPRAVVIPFGVMAEALGKSAQTKEHYDKLVRSLDRIKEEDFTTVVHELAALVFDLTVPAEVVDWIGEKFSEKTRLVVRSSANVEDLEIMTGAGLYESITNVPPDKVAQAIRKVWASLWTEGAARSRRQAAVPQETAHMAVLIQQIIDPMYSFISHTVNPITGRKDEIYIEMAVGLGEILASASVRGNPYRMVVDKKTGAMQMLAFADFSVALRPGRPGGITSVIIDYSKIPLTMNAEVRQRLAGRLATIAGSVEQALGRPQDIEGAVLDETIVLLQARPQQRVG